MLQFRRDGLAGLALLDEPGEISAVAALYQRLGEPGELAVIDPTLAPGDLLGTADTQALPLLDRLHELRGLQQRIVRTGVQPSKAPAHPLEPQIATCEISPVDVGDLELTTR